MARRGWHITVCSAYPADDRVEVLDRAEDHRGVHIRRCGLRLHLKKSLAHRAASYASYLWGSFFRLLRAGRNDLLFGVTNPPFAAIVLAVLKSLTGRPFTYMFLDLHPEGLVALGDLRADAPLVKLWVSLNRWAYRKADAIAVLGRDMRPLLKTIYGIPDERVEYIPHWSAVEAGQPLPFERSPFVERLGLQGKFVVQYSGNMGIWHDMDTFVRAAARLRHRDDIRFLFIGGGIRRSGAEDLARALDASNIVWRPFVPLEQLDDSLACCHVSLVSLRAGLAGVAVPCKVYGILASGRAIIAQVPRDSEVAYTIDDHRCGILVEPGDVDGLVSAIERLAADRATTLEMGARAFAAYAARYTVRQAADAFEAFFSKARS